MANNEQRRTSWESYLLQRNASFDLLTSCVTDFNKKRIRWKIEKADGEFVFPRGYLWRAFLRFALCVCFLTLTSGTLLVLQRYFVSHFNWQSGLIRESIEHSMWKQAQAATSVSFLLNPLIGHKPPTKFHEICLMLHRWPSLDCVFRSPSLCVLL